MKPRVLLDIDGVIADFYRGFAHFLNEKYGCSFDLNQQPDQYKFGEWGHGIDRVDTGEASSIWVKNGGFANIPIFPGAVEFTNELMSICDVFIVTARIGDWQLKMTKEDADKIKSDTKNWLDDHGISSDKLFFTHEKIDFCKDNNIKTMVEDKLDTALKASKSGINTILVHREYNGSKMDRFRIYRAYSYDDIIDRIRKMYQ